MKSKSKRKKDPPTVYVIAGPNGAGKTTFASEFLPDFVKCREFLNADLIAAGLSPFAPETQNVPGARLLLQRMKELAAAKANFGFETTLSGVTYLKILAKLKRARYRIELFFLWLPSAESAVTRVANRVQEGGHAVPEEDVRRRYTAGLRNFFRRYRRIMDAWWLYDSSRMPPVVIAYQQAGKLHVKQGPLYRRIENAIEVQHDEKRQR